MTDMLSEDSVMFRTCRILVHLTKDVGAIVHNTTNNSLPDDLLSLTRCFTILDRIMFHNPVELDSFDHFALRWPAHS